ncbi:MAG: hypothetical protein ACTSR8_04410 [Promethearchaeota archaeon]
MSDEEPSAPKLKKIIFLQGMECSGTNPKANLLRIRIPGIFTLTFYKASYLGDS